MFNISHYFENYCLDSSTKLGQNSIFTTDVIDIEVQGNLLTPVCLQLSFTLSSSHTRTHNQVRMLTRKNPPTLSLTHTHPHTRTHPFFHAFWEFDIRLPSITDETEGVPESFFQWLGSKKSQIWRNCPWSMNYERGRLNESHSRL